MTGRGTALFILIFVLLALPVFAIQVFGNCHDSEPCEKPLQHLVSQNRWNELGSPETVKYYIDSWLPPGVPSLTTDVPVASSKWSDIPFNGETVRFKLDYKGLMSRGAGSQDGWNVVGWSPLWPPGAVAKSTTWPDPAKPKRIIEADLEFSYYDPYAVHSDGSFPPDKFCVRNVATHEFGHWVELMDVGEPSWYDPNDNPNCQSYWHYTMHYAISMGQHTKEVLACEDKWGAWYTYNQLPPPAPPIPIFPTTAQAEGVEETRLLQNYPDPFNPETYIPYELKEDADVLLEIHDSTGHLVRKLVLGRKPRGQYVDQKHAAYWDGRTEKGELVPSGVYFYTLKAGDFSATRKMILLK